MEKSSQGSRVREMTEAMLGLGSVIGLSWWLPGSWRPAHFVFCAFFIVVFAIAVRYHPSVAYGASSLAAISYGMLLWLQPETRMQLHFFYLALEPFLLLISGIFTSDILRWQRQRLHTLEQKYTSLDKIFQKTQQHYQMTLTINEALERQIAGQPTSALTMSDKIVHLWKPDSHERYSAILDMITSVFEVQSCALYLRRNARLHLYARYPDKSPMYAPILNTNDPLIKRVIEQRKVSTIRDSLLEKQSVQREVAIMAGPLLDQAGEIVGMVVIDSMPLLKFTPGTVCLFSSLLQMVSLSLQTAGSVARGRNSPLDWAVIDPDLTAPVIPTLSSSGIARTR